jgi:regulator of cell morphogenesis and NO signaling
VNTTLTPEMKVGQLAAEYPLATRVFARHQIDYCCGGGRPLAEVCRTKGLDPARVLTEIEQEIAPADRDVQRWIDAPLGALIDHILTDYHRPLYEELPRLEAMVQKVARVHGDKEPVRLPELLSVFTSLKAELEDHFTKEEAVLFPMINRGEGGGAQGPVAVMLREHDDAGDALRRIRELTDDYTPPEGACNTWRALWYGLAALETSLHEHIHLENNILFPRALAGA